MKHHSFARTLALCLAFLGLLAAAPAARAVDWLHEKKGRKIAALAINWLRTQQDQATGGWSVSPEGQPNFPAITALVVSGMLKDPTIDERDAAVARGIAYILRFRQPDGGLYDRVLPSYNTAICLSTLSQVKRPEAAACIEPAISFLRTLQWSPESGDHPNETGRVSMEHPFYGGVGYGRHGRPDNSNLGMFVEAMHDAGLASTDPAFGRALTFLARTQMDDRVNDMPYARGSRQGGFIYATAPSGDAEGQGQSQAGEIEETLPDGSKVMRLRAYGSMTYTGFKSMIYANLSREDMRVRVAHDWIRRNYTLEENPGAGTDGLYYYLLAFARALDAWGSDTITPLNADGTEAPPRDWRHDLIDRLTVLQTTKGSFRSVDDRWMEDNEVLITAYSLIALQHAMD